MGLSFAFVVGTGCIAGLLRHRTQGEMCYLCNGIALVCVLSALILAPFWIRVVILVFILGEQLLKTHSPLAIVQQRHVDVVPPLDQPDASLQVDSTASPVVEPQCRYRGVSYTPSTKPAVER